MKKYLFILSLITLSTVGRSQRFEADSLFKIIETAKADSDRINAGYHIMMSYSASNLDSLIHYTQKTLAFAQKNHLPQIEAWATLELGYSFFRMGDIGKSQEYGIKGSKLLEDHPDNLLNAMASDNATLYLATDSLKILATRKAIEFYSKSSSADGAYYMALYHKISTLFLKENELDSALVYAQKADAVSMKRNGGLTNANVASLYSRIYLQLKQNDLALTYARKSLELAQKSKTPAALNLAYNAMAGYFNSMHMDDSAFSYYLTIYSMKSNPFYQGKINAAGWLYKYYERNHQGDSALKFAAIFLEGKDSLNNINRAMQVQKVNIEEGLRQQELITQKLRAEDQRKQNVQFALIALGIITFIILFLLLSRSFITNTKAIEFLGVIALLIVFEFLNLVLHPFLEKVTYHSPILMLLALVCIAALLVPLHHRIEKIATAKLVEKNKRIRLAAAKKTIEQLDKKRAENL